MKKESIKSIVLFVLVVISIILTVRLWNFNPEFDQIENEVNPKETSINGLKLRIRDTIHPSHIIIHKNGSHFQLTAISSEDTLFREMQQWLVQQFGPIGDLENILPIDQTNIEVRFPTEIPLSLISQLFKVSSGEVLPENFTFDRVFYIPNMELQTSIRVIFASSEQNKAISAEIYPQATNPFQSLLSYLENDDALTELQPIEIKDGKIVYLPTKNLELQKQTYLTNEISDWPLVNILFQDPTTVKNNGSYYTDGDRKLETHRAFSNKKYMNFVNPMFTETRVYNKRNLIDRTTAFMNNHDGWTDKFVLMGIDNENTTATYYMVLNGYPLLDPLGKMEIVWREDQLNEYNRPLIDIDLLLDFDYQNQTKTLPNANELISYFESNNFKTSLSQVEDIRIGYHIINEEDNLIWLEPSWYIKINDTWRPILSQDTPDEGGI
jgi:regulatory protein YycH of two-component signal transduction system YycFG